MAELTASHIEYLASQLLGRLATTGADHMGPGFGEAFIRIHPEKINSFGIP